MNFSPGTNQATDHVLRTAWSRLPAGYEIPEHQPSLEEARAYCERLARSHYENFSVATWFLPKRLHRHFFSVYAYCRISDDLGDEVGDPQMSLALLELWQRLAEGTRNLSASQGLENRLDLFLAQVRLVHRDLILC